MLSKSQKQLVLKILLKENKRWFSRHKGELLEKTIADLVQMIRNETVNSNQQNDSSLDWSSRDRRKR
jgi:hypothetical protein